ncbi:unnamed protein product, partial [Ixodes pacificus]
ATPGVRHRVITDVDDEGHRLVEIFQASNGTVLDCNILGSKVIIDTVLKIIPEEMVTKVTKDQMQHFLDLCDKYYEAAGDGSLYSRFLLVIEVPTYKVFHCAGTKWCGPGDVAKDYDDLGRESVTDMCSRDHDHATDSLAPFETEHGVTNVMLYTM